MAQFIGNASGKDLPKCPTGIPGFDGITCGGLPRGRTTLVCGDAGSGKTLLAVQFLVNGALHYDEPGVLMSFEENETEIVENAASLGFDLAGLTQAGKLALDYVYLERSEIAETGEYDLEGLFLRLEAAITSVGAKRVVLDTIEALFSGLSNTAILRAELRRLFRWLKTRGVTTIVTGERGTESLTRHGIEEYVSDCVILLDHRIDDQISTRRLCVRKYRGSAHGSNEYPFLIDEQGISLMPITSLQLSAAAPTARVPTGIPRLDAMLGGTGFYAGSSVLVSGTAGTGKTTLAAQVADTACRRGEKCLYFAFEESQEQIIRNMASVNIDLGQWVERDLLRIVASRVTSYGLEMHLAGMYKEIDRFGPQLVVIDPMTDLMAVGKAADVKIMLTRLMDFLKNRGITILLLDLSEAGHTERTWAGISSLADTWIVLRDIELGGERNRGLYVLKARGMAHSNQIREFVLTDEGLDLLDVYVGPEGVLTGSARYAQQAKEKAQAVARQQEIARKRRELEHKRRKLATAIAELEAAFAAEQAEVEQALAQEESRLGALEGDRRRLANLRKADDEEQPGRKVGQ